MLVSIIARLTEEQKAALEALSRKTGAPQSELLRRALDEYLRDKGNLNAETRQGNRRQGL